MTPDTFSISIVVTVAMSIALTLLRNIAHVFMASGLFIVSKSHYFRSDVCSGRSRPLSTKLFFTAAISCSFGSALPAFFSTSTMYSSQVAIILLLLQHSSCLLEQSCSLVQQLLQRQTLLELVLLKVIFNDGSVSC